MCLLAVITGRRKGMAMDEVDDGKGRRVWFFFGFVFIKQRVRAVHSKASSGEIFKPSAPDHPNGFPKACTRLYYKKYIYIHPKDSSALFLCAHFTLTNTHHTACICLTSDQVSMNISKGCPKRCSRDSISRYVRPLAFSNPAPSPLLTLLLLF